MISAPLTWPDRPLGRITRLEDVRATVISCLDGSADIDAAQDRLLAGFDPLDVGVHSIRDPVLRALLIIALLGGRTRRWERIIEAIEACSDVPDEVLGVACHMAGTAIRRVPADTDPTAMWSFMGALAGLDRDGDLGTGVGSMTAGGSARRLGGRPASSGIDKAVQRGQWREADRAILAALGRPDCPGAVSAALRVDQALLAGAQGRVAETRDLIDDAWEWSAPRGFHAVHRAMLAAQGLLALGAGDFEEAYLLLVAGLPPGPLHHPRPVGATVLLDLTESAARTGRFATAEACASMAAEAAGRSAVEIAVSSACRAVVSSGAASIALFDSAAAAIQDAEAPFVVARIALLQGERLRRERVVGEARVRLRAALSVFRRLGTDGWAERAAAELSAAGSEHRRSGVTMTSREQHVADLAARGFTNRQIGEQLLVSPRTVEAHLRHVYDKLDVHSRTALIAVMRRTPSPLTVTGGRDVH